MPKYKTLDQHIRYHGKYIEPNTVVNVPPQDVPIWDELVDLKVAEKVATKKQEEPPEEGQPAPPGAKSSDE